MTDNALRSTRTLAGQGLALVRIIVGLWFAKALDPVGARPGRWLPAAARYASDPLGRDDAEDHLEADGRAPGLHVKAFVEGTVLTNVVLFADLHGAW